ncbi:IS110 family transposase [Eisenbergiella tayi]|uniref:IS110 family transposase n=1 Tax=Candidatus Gemmiger avicola TaxID=2838605 RepID=A0A9D2M790_9FIRM|nr:IS110 family transposase [Lachnoclostridium sp. An138]HJB42130.1 IS110 family transposase [Candidatus Gemmiger avicola]
MNAAGIDISSRKSTVAVLRPFGEVVEVPFDVQHNAEALTALAEQLKSIDGETRVVMEHTGRYYESVAKTLHEAGLFVSAVNPLLIKEYGNNSLRRVKTDKADAMKIARYALDNWVELRDYTPMDTIRYDLKTLNRQFQLASKQKTATANNLIALQEQSFPGIRKLFDSPVRSDGTQKWVDFTHDFYHVDCVRSGSQNTFTERYRKWCKRNHYNFNAGKAAEIYALAKSAVVLVQKTPLTKTLLQEAANQLTAISRSVETYRSEMNKLASQLPEYPVIMEMYGVGESLGPQLMAEIGDVRRFERKQSLVAFAGIDPMPNQSGEKNVRSNKSSKRGSPYLRKTLFNIMGIYLKCSPQDEPVYQFLDRKRAEGKPYYVYMTAAGNKFLRRYYATVMNYFATLENLPPVDTDSTGLQHTE